MRGIKHGRHARGFAPVFAPAPFGDRVQAVIPVVVILGFGIDDIAKRPLAESPPTVNDARTVIAGFTEHVDAPGFADRTGKGAQFAEG